MLHEKERLRDAEQAFVCIERMQPACELCGFEYSKMNPRASGARTLRREFGQRSRAFVKSNSALPSNLSRSVGASFAKQPQGYGTGINSLVASPFASMIRKSGHRFSEKIMLKQKVRAR
jgi:hypothetical protein